MTTLRQLAESWAIRSCPKIIGGIVVPSAKWTGALEPEGGRRAAGGVSTIAVCGEMMKDGDSMGTWDER